MNVMRMQVQNLRRKKKFKEGILELKCTIYEIKKKKKLTPGMLADNLDTAVKKINDLRDQ